MTAKRVIELVHDDFQTLLQEVEMKILPLCIAPFRIYTSRTGVLKLPLRSYGQP